MNRKNWVILDYLGVPLGTKILLRSKSFLGDLLHKKQGDFLLKSDFTQIELISYLQVNE